MKLDRHIAGNDGRGKYALLKLRSLSLCESDNTFERFTPEIEKAIALLEQNGILDWGQTGTENEFFLMRLKDKYSREGLLAYAAEARKDDPEWAAEVEVLAARSGPRSPWCKLPD